jgi:hypothetical protein
MKRAPIAVVTGLFAALFTMVARQSAFLQLNGRFGEAAMTAAGRHRPFRTLTRPQTSPAFSCVTPFIRRVRGQVAQPGKDAAPV